MACSGFSKTALMGNWYEERLANSQPMRENPDYRFVREEEQAIAYMTQNNKLHPLPRHKRVPKWDTSQVIVDDKFREYRSVNKTAFDPLILHNYHNVGDCRPIVKSELKPLQYPEQQTQIQTADSKRITMLHGKNFSQEITDKTRDVKMSMSDFGSTFKKHNLDHQRFFNMTTHHEAFDRPTKQTPQEFTQTQLEKLNRFGGKNPRPYEQTGIKMTSALTGEQYKNQKDPQQNTKIQRSWLPYKENALEAAENNIKQNTMRNTSLGLKTTETLANYRTNLTQTLPYDIATSLPMEDGVYALKSKYMEPGAFRKIRSDVTMIRNNPLTKK